MGSYQIRFSPPASVTGLFMYIPPSIYLLMHGMKVVHVHSTRTHSQLVCSVALNCLYYYSSLIQFENVAHFYSSSSTTRASDLLLQQHANVAGSFSSGSTCAAAVTQRSDALARLWARTPLTTAGSFSCRAPSLGRFRHLVVLRARTRHLASASTR